MQKLPCRFLGARENCNGELRIDQDFLDDASARDQRRLAVLSHSEVEISIRVRFDLSASIVEPWMNQVSPTEDADAKEKSIKAPKEGDVAHPWFGTENLVIGRECFS